VEPDGPQDPPWAAGASGAPAAAADAGHRQAAPGSRRDSIDRDTAMSYLAENVELKARVQQLEHQLEQQKQRMLQMQQVLQSMQSQLASSGRSLLDLSQQCSLGFGGVDQAPAANASMGGRPTTSQQQQQHHGVPHSSTVPQQQQQQQQQQPSSGPYPPSMPQHSSVTAGAAGHPSIARAAAAAAAAASGVAGTAGAAVGHAAGPVGAVSHAAGSAGAVGHAAGSSADETAEAMLDAAVHAAMQQLGAGEKIALLYVHIMFALIGITTQIDFRFIVSTESITLPCHVLCRPCSLMQQVTTLSKPTGQVAAPLVLKQMRVATCSSQQPPIHRCSNK
jgi:hypothetical protein